jgi:hypothetical protein
MQQKIKNGIRNAAKTNTKTSLQCGLPRMIRGCEDEVIKVEAGKL